VRSIVLPRAIHEIGHGSTLDIIKHGIPEFEGDDPIDAKAPKI
jgi:hypothetical protein